MSHAGIAQGSRVNILYIPLPFPVIRNTGKYLHQILVTMLEQVFVDIDRHIWSLFQVKFGTGNRVDPKLKGLMQARQRSKRSGN
jgi:hypothetical protein